MTPSPRNRCWCSSYDSEEERLRARQLAAGRGAAMQAKQEAQAQLLQAYRARQQQRLHLEEEALRAKLLLQQQHRCMGEGPSEGGWEPGNDASGGAAATGKPCTRAWLRALQQHESQWSALEASAGSGGSAGSADGRISGVAYADVPWPPLDCAEYLQALAALEQQQQQQRADADQQAGSHQQGQGRQEDPGKRQQRSHRRAYTRACLRWHPDKFAARWGRLLAEADSQRILQRVQQLSQGLNQAWEALQQEGRQREGDEPIPASSPPT